MLRLISSIKVKTHPIVDADEDNPIVDMFCCLYENIVGVMTDIMVANKIDRPFHAS